MLLQHQSSLDIVKGIEMVQEVQEELKEVREEVDDCTVKIEVCMTH